MKKLKTVVSVFDGKSCGQIALNHSNIKYDSYFASEVNSDPIKITQENYPNTIQLGDVREITYKDGVIYTKTSQYNVGHVDLLLGGTPCQNLSFAGKRKGLSTKEGLEITTLSQYLTLKNEGFEFEGQSYLFWEFVRLKQEMNPTYYIMENVKMEDKWKSIFDNILNKKGVLINSSNFSAQNRPRNYWTNLEILPFEDKGLIISDILDENWDENLLVDVSKKKSGRYTKNYYQYDLSGKGNGSQDQRGYFKNGKCGTLDRGCANKHKLFIDENTMRKFTISELERLQTVPVGYTKAVSRNKAGEMLGNGWNIDTIVHLLKGL